MATQNPVAQDVLDKEVKDAVIAQIGELGQPVLDKLVKTQTVLRTLQNLAPLLGGQAMDPPNALLLAITNQVTAIAAAGSKRVAEFGTVLADLDRLVALTPTSVADTVGKIVVSIQTQIKALLNHRPDVQAVMHDLEALKHLKGGPADATAFHDFNVLQMAFKNVWKHAYDKNVQALVEQVYLEHMKLYEDAGLQLPPFGAISDVNDLLAFADIAPTNIAPPAHLLIEDTASDQSNSPSPIAVKVFEMLGMGGLADLVPPMIPSISRDEVLAMFQAGWVWGKLSPEQQYIVWEQAAIVKEAEQNGNEAEGEKAKKIVYAILNNPAGPAGRIATLLYKLGQAIAEPYAFDVFASYNFGLMVTYRQKWEPGEYQAGDLVATVPLAPGETRKYSTRHVVKKGRASKEVEKALSSSAYQTSETGRAEADIMKKTTTATNFKMNADGSFNIGIGSIHSSTEFALNQATESVSNKKEFREATLKAAQEYRLERSLEVDTTSSIDDEQTTSGEISNPNNEITVTYLFYELQRRYKISEFLYRVRPVIMVALDVPAPHEIDEAWLIRHQWIIARVLLDDSFRSALTYLSSGFGGDEVSLEVKKRHWATQKDLVKTLEEKTRAQMEMRDHLREMLVKTQLEKESLPSMPGALKFFTMGMDPTEGASDILEANRKAAETRLGYVESALADAQEKLKQAASAFDNATKAYTDALREKFSRRVDIDKYRAHVKENIFHYMQAIWSHAVADQRFFELYKLPIDCPEPSSKKFLPKGNFQSTSGGVVAKNTAYTLNINMPAPSSTWKQEDLVEVADLDNPLGFKGNFIIFPMKQHCYLTQFMLQGFIDEHTNGLRDPDKIAYFLENFDRHWLEAAPPPEGKGSTTIDGVTFTQDDLKVKLKDFVQTARRATEEIIVPSGQLFIEALPGSHPLLEDFKLLHRVEDVRKVKAEVRHAELENLRLAGRLMAGEMEDPDIEKKIIVENGASVVVGDGN